VKSRPAVVRALGLSVCAVAILISALILWHFHDRFWYPSDEGIYANQAERIAAGETLNVDVQELHPGYGTFINAAALRLFGNSLLSLRYPLVAAALCQSLLAFVLLARRSVLLAAFGAVATTALGVVQFLNPTPNWYCLALAFALAHWLCAFPRNSARRLIGAGFLAGVIGLLRQLSGVWVVIAVVVIALLDRPETPARTSRLAKAVLIALLLLALGFLAGTREAEPGVLVLFIPWPTAILVAAIRRVRLSDAQTATALLQLAAGAVLGAAPLLFYMSIHQSGAAWFNDTVTSAFHLGDVVGNRDGGPWFAALAAAAASQAIGSLHLVKIVNGIYWMVLPLLATINGVLAIRRMQRTEDSSELVLPVLAAFYSLVALFMQNAIYLYFTAGLTLTAVLYMVGRSRLAVRVTWAGLTLLLTVVALAYHAAQPYTRAPLEALEGRRTSTVVSDCGLPRCGLRLDPADVAPYRRLVALIQDAVPAQAPIAAFPSDAELYFLSDRRNPFRFYNAAIGLRTSDDVDAAIGIIKREAPRLITFRPQDKYTTDATRAVIAGVRSLYDHATTIDGVEIYRLTATYGRLPFNVEKYDDTFGPMALIAPIAPLVMIPMSNPYSIRSWPESSLTKRLNSASICLPFEKTVAPRCRGVWHLGAIQRNDVASSHVRKSGTE